VGVSKVVIMSARRGVKYSPHIAAIVREVRGPASEYAKATMEATRQKRLALTKARSVRDGSVLLVLHGEQPVWVVSSGDVPVSQHPAVGVPLADLVAHADLDRRRTPEEFPSPRERVASAGKKTASKVAIRRKRPAEEGPKDAPAGDSD
jgi:hypothetical protein